MEKIEKILTDCITEIKAGKASMNECLSRYPSLRRELEPLLKLALNIQPLSDVRLQDSSKQAIKARLMQNIGRDSKQKARSFTDIFNFGIPARFAWARIAVSVIAIVLVLSILAGGTAYASQDSLPGDILYPVKTTTENFRLFVAADEADKAELSLQFAQTRLEEMDALASVDEHRAALAVQGYENNLKAAREQALAIPDASVQKQMLKKMLTGMQNQMSFCDGVIDAGPAHAGPVRQAISLTAGTQSELLKFLEQQDVAAAAQINLDIMQNRLQRAHAMAGSARFTEMAEALAQYRQFCGLGEEILQTARAQDGNAVQVEELSLNALADDLNIIEDIAQETPQEYRHAVETSRESTVNFQSRAGARNQHGQKGEDGAGRELPKPGEENPGDSGNSGKGQGQNNPPHQGGNGSPGTAVPSESTTPSGGPSGTPEEAGGGNNSPGLNGGNVNPANDESPQSGNGGGPSEAGRRYSGGENGNKNGR